MLSFLLDKAYYSEVISESSILIKSLMLRATLSQFSEALVFQKYSLSFIAIICTMVAIVFHLKALSLYTVALMDIYESLVRCVKNFTYKNFMLTFQPCLTSIYGKNLSDSTTHNNIYGNVVKEKQISVSKDLKSPSQTIEVDELRQLHDNTVAMTTRDLEREGWELMMDRRTNGMRYRAWRRDRFDCGLTEYRSSTLMKGVEAKEINRMYLDDKNRLEWDFCFKVGKMF